MRRVVLCLAALCAAVLLAPRTSSAQAAIAGAVKDATGAVMPGVTVEASSPALIEKTRIAVTDGAGQYKIVDLPPGMYQVAFTLAGFKSVRRGGIVLEGTFTPTVNAELQVGAMEETLTVTAESPIVDVVKNTTEFVANRDVLDSIPTPIRNTPARALLIPGTTVVFNVLGQYNMRVHGSDTSDLMIAIDGMRVNNLCGSGQFSGFYMNDASVQEVTYTTGAESAEMQAGGLRINSVPKDGGNTFSGSVFVYGQGSSLQADNRSDAVKPLISIAKTAYDYQINPSFGGPLKKDTLWFYFTYKYQDNKFYVPSSKFADGSPAFRNAMGNYSGVGRVTWAASSRDKIRVYVEKQFNGEFYNGFSTLATTSPEASTDAFGNGWVPQIKWTRAQSTRLLVEAGISYYNQPYEQNYRPTAGPLDLGHLESTTGRLTVAAGNTIPPYKSATEDYSMMAAASYVTGSHAIKAGMTDGWGTNSRTFTSHAEINTLVFAGGAPIAVAVANTPASAVQKVNSDLGMFIQDTWTRNRLTLNYGARYDHFNAEVPAESSAAGPWIQARNFPAIENVPNWNDWSIRLAGAYDLFGTGKTALKLNAGKYVASQAAGYAADPRVARCRPQWIDPRRERQHPVQRSDRRHIQLRSNREPPGSEPRARLQLGVQRRGAARAGSAPVGHRRLLPPAVLQPADPRQPECRRERLELVRDRGADRHQTADVRSAAPALQPEPQQERRGDRRSVYILDRESHDLQRLRGERERAIQQSAHVRRRDDRSQGDHVVRRFDQHQ